MMWKSRTPLNMDLHRVGPIQFKIPETEQQELLGWLLPQHDEIVEVKMSNPLDVPQQRASRELSAG